MIAAATTVTGTPTDPVWGDVVLLLFVGVGALIVITIGWALLDGLRNRTPEQALGDAFGAKPVRDPDGVLHLVPRPRDGSDH